MKEVLEQLFEHKTLSRGEAKQTLIEIGEGRHNPSHISSFLTAFLMRHITLDEIAGFRDGLLQLAQRVDLNDFNAMDVCGTGGDGKNTFNVSTVVAFVVAGAGIPVAKHGNHGMSSISGSSTVLEQLGFRFTNDEYTLRRHMEEAGICFLHAPIFHPAMRFVAPIRKELGIKTFFNMLGPLVNPAQPAVQMTGVFSLELARRYQYLLQGDDKRFSIVHALDGYDEITLTGEARRFTQFGEEVIAAADFGLEPVKASQLAGASTVADAAKLLPRILQGDGTEQQTRVVLANSAVAIQTYRPELDLPGALDEARESLAGKKALKCFQTLYSLS